jgi:hypothetical protein
VSRARWYSLSARSNSLESVLTCSSVTPIPVRSFALLQLVNLIPAPCGVIKRSQERGSSLPHLKGSRNGDCSVFILQTSTACAGILKQSMGARKRVGIGLSNRPARLHMLAKSIPWKRFLYSLKV